MLWALHATMVIEEVRKKMTAQADIKIVQMRCCSMSMSMDFIRR